MLFGAAPPCQDFSLIGPGEGHRGARGRLFSASAEFMQAIFDDLPGYNTASIFENVLMNSADTKTVTEKPARATLDGSLARGFLGPVRRLRLGLGKKGWLPPPTAQYAPEGGHRLLLHADVASGRKHMPCATTPAPTEEGPAPKSSRGRTPKHAQERWLADKRQYAPWHYKREAMLTSPTGEMCVPSRSSSTKYPWTTPGSRGFRIRADTAWLALGSATGMLHTSMAGVHLASSPGLGTAPRSCRTSPTWPGAGEPAPPPGWAPGRPTSRRSTQRLTRTRQLGSHSAQTRLALDVLAELADE